MRGPVTNFSNAGVYVGYTDADLTFDSSSVSFEKDSVYGTCLVG